MRGFNRQGMRGMRLQGQRRAMFGDAATDAAGSGNFAFGRRMMCRRNVGDYGRFGAGGAGTASTGPSSLQMLKDEAQRLKTALQDIEQQIDSLQQP